MSSGPSPSGPPSAPSTAAVPAPWPARPASPEDTARQVIQRWRRTYPRVIAYGKRLAELAEVVTASGRRIPADPARPYANANYAVQSTARDLLLAAVYTLVTRHQVGGLWLFVHDEIIVQAPEHDAERVRGLLERAMTSTFRGLPIVADAKILGPAWGQHDPAAPAPGKSGTSGTSGTCAGQGQVPAGSPGLPRFRNLRNLPPPRRMLVTGPAPGPMKPPSPPRCASSGVTGPPCWSPAPARAARTPSPNGCGPHGVAGSSAIRPIGPAAGTRACAATPPWSRPARTCAWPSSANTAPARATPPALPSTPVSPSATTHPQEVTMPPQPPAAGRGTAALLNAARWCAGRGWHVFPLRPGDKRPAFPDHKAEDCTGTDPRCRGGHQGWEPRATTDPGRIGRAWARTPYNIGLACGPSGLLVIDLDTPKPGEVPPPEWALPGVTDGADVLAVLCERHGQPFPCETFMVRTRRGGLHLYFTAPPGVRLGNTSGRSGRGLGWLIDTRGHGGYVVAPGSFVDLPDGTGRYEVVYDRPPAPLPDWLAALLTARPPPIPRLSAVRLPLIRFVTWTATRQRHSGGRPSGSAQPPKAAGTTR